MLWDAGIHIHFVVLMQVMEPQSSENCAFFVLASGHKCNNMLHEYSHIKVSMHASLEINIEKIKHYLWLINMVVKTHLAIWR